VNIAEAADVLAMAAAFDSRTVGKADILAWHAVIGHLEPSEARDAVVAHYSETRDRIMPVDVLTRVTKLRALRIAHAGPEAVPDADPDDVPAYQAALREGRFRVAAGLAPRPVRQAVQGAFQSVEPVQIRRAIAAAPVGVEPPAEPEDPDYALAKAVLEQMPNAHEWLTRAAADLEGAGECLNRRAVAIHAADLATQPGANPS
jgi:hypothetical protein